MSATLLELPSDSPHHQSSRDSDPSATVGVRDDVSISNGQEGDCRQPHGVQEVCVFRVVISADDGQLVKYSVKSRIPR